MAFYLIRPELRSPDPTPTRREHQQQRAMHKPCRRPLSQAHSGFELISITPLSPSRRSPQYRYDEYDDVIRSTGTNHRHQTTTASKRQRSSTRRRAGEKHHVEAPPSAPTSPTAPNQPPADHDDCSTTSRCCALPTACDDDARTKQTR